MHFLSALTFGLSVVASASALAIPTLDDITEKFSSLVTRQTATQIQQETDRLLYYTSMSNFLAAKAARNPPYLSWEDNGCTFSPDKPNGFNFLPSCQRHDFGYWNYPIQKRCSETDRKRIDDNFKVDLYNECNKYGTKTGQCRDYANVYYNAVRTLGGTRWC